MSIPPHLAERDDGSGHPAVVVEDDRTGMDPTTLGRAFTDHLLFSQLKDIP